MLIYFHRIAIQVMQKYRPVIFTGWVLMITGLGLLSLLKSTSSTGLWVGLQIVAGAGSGLLVRTLSLSLNLILSTNAVAIINFSCALTASRHSICGSFGFLQLCSDICNGKIIILNTFETVAHTCRHGESQYPAPSYRMD